MSLHRHLTAAALTLAGCVACAAEPARAGNPVFPGWYADPEGTILGDRYWIFPTASLDYNKQTYFDAFSSPDLVTWTNRSEEMSLWDAFLMAEKSMRASLWSVTAQGAQLILTIRPRGRHFSLPLSWNRFY